MKGVRMKNIDDIERAYRIQETLKHKLFLNKKQQSLCEDLMSSYAVDMDDDAYANILDIHNKYSKLKEQFMDYVFLMDILEECINDRYSDFD